MPWFYVQIMETPGEGHDWYIGEYKTAVDAVSGAMRRFRPDAMEIEVYCDKLAERCPAGTTKAAFTRSLRKKERDRQSKPPAF